MLADHARHDGESHRADGADRPGMNGSRLPQPCRRENVDRQKPETDGDPTVRMSS
jgi:hypothetical protein